MKLPKERGLEPCFWSYRFEDLDTEVHKSVIIKQVLEYGDRAATDWLWSVYHQSEVAEVVTASAASEWSKKTKNYLEQIFDMAPAQTTRFS